MDERSILRETARSLVERESPIERVRKTGPAHDELLWRKVVEAGWLSMSLPEGAGGHGAGLAELGVVVEELGRGLAAPMLLPTALAARALAASKSHQGNEALEATLAGNHTLTIAVDAGMSPASDAGLVRALAPGARHARNLIAPTPTEDDLLILEINNPGVEVHEQTSLDLTRWFFNVTSAFEAGSALHAGPETVRRFRDEGTALVCAETVGAAARLVDMTVAYAKERVQFGRAIGSFQAVKHRCADMLIALEASRAATDVALRALDAGASDAGREVSAAKAYTGEACARLANDALQVHGGIGFTWELDVHLYLRRIRSNRALFGTPSTHRDRLYEVSAP